MENTVPPYVPEPLPIFFAPLFVDLRPDRLHIVTNDHTAVTSSHGRVVFLNSFAVTGHEVGQAIKRSPLNEQEKGSLLSNAHGIFNRIIGMVEDECKKGPWRSGGHLDTKALTILTGGEKKENARQRGQKAKAIIKHVLEHVPGELLTLAKERRASIVVIPDAGNSHNMIVGDKNGAAFNTDRNILFISESLLEDSRLTGVLREELRHAADCTLGWFSRKPEFVEAYNAFASRKEHYALASQRLAEVLPKASLSQYVEIWRPSELLVNFFHLKDALEEGRFPPHPQPRTFMEKITFQQPKLISLDTESELKRVFGENLYRLCMEFESKTRQKANSMHAPRQER